MNAKNLRIGTQLKIGFAAVLLFVIVLGVISSRHSDEISQQTEVMYKHPLAVRRAIGSLEAGILSMRLGARDLILAESDEDRQSAIQLIEVSSADALQQFQILTLQYLGPPRDIDAAYKAFIVWRTAREENTKLALAGKIGKVKKSLLAAGSEGVLREELNARIHIIDDFAANKAVALHANSQELRDELNRQLGLLVVAILLLSLIISAILLRNIRRPLDELTVATRRFQGGEKDARCSYASGNEFGMLSASFNSLAESIQVKTELDEKIANLAALMMSEYDVKVFFQATLNALAAHTGSHMAAIYLLSDDKKSYTYFESTGLDGSIRQSFAADSFEGEFGPVLSSQKVQHIRRIPEDTRFIFSAVSGRFIPREIITLPIITDNEIIAVISLASLGEYRLQSIQLIDSILVTLSARVEGILAYHKIKEVSGALEHQNRELETQKAALTSLSEELRHQNTELEMQKRQLDEASRLKTNFLSTMSHELRTPLNSVIALSSVLNRRLANQIPEEEYSYLEVIERNGKHLLSLINDILDISRIEAGREEIEITRFRAGNLVAEVVAMIRPQAREKSIELVYAEGGPDVFVLSDVDKCRHILQNLIGKAVKFTEQGKVEIVVAQHDSNVTITVTDSGIGIAAAHLPEIFDEFRQADGSTSRRFGGTGLGLAIAKKYATMLGGMISVKSIPGQGSEFSLELPLNYLSASTKAETESTPPPECTVSQRAAMPLSDGQGDIRGTTVLLVEDSEPAIVQIKYILEESGCAIVVARNGAEALANIDRTIPDAMILDLMMPGIDGFAVLKTIRESASTARIPVLILTAKHITKDELRSLKQNNVHQLIQKGDVNPGELQRAIAAMVLSNRRHQDAPPPKPLPITGKPVVLVVEDNADSMLTVKALLAETFVVLEASDGRQGLEIARQHEPHLILMDIGLPGMDGIETFKAIRREGVLRHIPVIALTASAMTQDRESILAHGFDAFVAKPIDEQLLFRTIDQALYGK